MRGFNKLYKTKYLKNVEFGSKLMGLDFGN